MSHPPRSEEGRWSVAAICGPRAAGADLLRQAERLGARIAAAGWAVACGGLGGVMEAAARGARRGRGGPTPPVIGIVPGSQASEANAFCDVVIATGVGIARNAILVQSADAVVLCGGGAGTLSEAAMAWQLGKRVIALAGSGGWADELGAKRIDDRREDRVIRAGDVEEVVRCLQELAP